MATREAQARWRAKKRAENDPTRRYLRDVMTWAEKHGTPGAGRLALAAAAMMEKAERGPQDEAPSFYELMGFAKPERARYTSSEASRIALAALGRAQTDLDSGEASERAVSAGLAMAKHLLATPRRREADGEARLRFLLATIGAPAPAHLTDLADEDDAGPVVETDA